MTEAAVSSDPQSSAARKVGAALGIGILVLPWIFAWFLVRRGYSNIARLISFGWMLTVIIFAIVGGGRSDQAATSSFAPAAPAAKETVPELETKLTPAQKNAVRSAKQYLSMTGFSRDGLVQQLSSSAGDGYELADATAAVDSLEVDWNENAVKSANQYLSISGFSCKGLIEQLSSSSGDKYTESQATFGAQKAGACS